MCCEDDYFPYLIYLVFPKSLFYIADLFAVRSLWIVCREDKCCVLTQRETDIRVAWPVYVRTYCVPIATLNQNKRTRLLYLGDTQIIRFKPRIKLNRDMYIYFFTQIGLVA